MKNVLVVQSSPRGESSVSRKLTAQLLAQLNRNGGIQVVQRDLSAHPLPHLQQAQLEGFFTPPDKRTLEQQEAILDSEMAVRELKDADILVISAPVWNFGIPSVLKAWIDHVVRAGHTFSYGPDGPKGLLKGKRVFVVTASGSVLSGGAFDFQEPYLRGVLGFMGLHDVTFIRAEGLSDPQFKESAYSEAEREIELAAAYA